MWSTVSCFLALYVGLLSQKEEEDVWEILWTYSIIKVYEGVLLHGDFVSYALEWSYVWGILLNEEHEDLVGKWFHISANSFVFQTFDLKPCVNSLESSF